MIVYTSYFSNLRKIDTDVIVPISICLYAPNFYNGLHFKILAPSDELLKSYKQNNDTVEYTKVFNEKLSKLNPNVVYKILNRFSRGKDVVLLCYEAPDKFCHRHLVSEWFNKNGIESKEL